MNEMMMYRHTTKGCEIITLQCFDNLFSEIRDDVNSCSSGSQETLKFSKEQFCTFYIKKICVFNEHSVTPERVVIDGKIFARSILSNFSGS